VRLYIEIWLFVELLFATSATKIESLTVIFRFMFSSADINRHPTDRVFRFLLLYSRYSRRLSLDRSGTVQLDYLGKDTYSDFFGRSGPDINSCRSLYLA
jgi:hypothetical protein